MPTTNPKVETLQYDIVKGSKTIGTILATKSTLNNESKYELTSSVSFRFIGEISIKSVFKTHFTDDVLTYAFSENLLNDKQKEFSEIQWDGNQYHVQLKKENKTIENEKITYSMLSLYYQEPKHVQQVFSERFAEYCQIKEIETDKYELTLPDGNKNYYYYQDGICTRVEVERTLMDVAFILQEE